MTDDTADIPPSMPPPGLREGSERVPSGLDQAMNDAARGMTVGDLMGQVNTPSGPDTPHLIQKPDWMSRVSQQHDKRQFEAIRRAVVSRGEPARETANAMTELLAARAKEREENERKDAERDAREQRALKVAEDSLAEARRSRIIAAWSVGVAVAALIVAVIAIFAAG